MSQIYKKLKRLAGTVSEEITEQLTQHPNSEKLKQTNKKTVKTRVNFYYNLILYQIKIFNDHYTKENTGIQKIKQFTEISCKVCRKLFTHS